MSEKNNDNRLWYIRGDHEAQGPFPSDTISRYLLIGRIEETDELSEDGKTWRQVTEYPELLPEVMRNIVTEEDREKLLLARLREDERLTDKRDNGQFGNEGRQTARRQPERRQGERRQPEPKEVLHHRMLKSELTKVYSERTAKDFFLLITVVIVFAIMIVALVLWYRPTPERPTVTGTAEQAASDLGVKNVMRLR